MAVETINGRRLSYTRPGKSPDGPGLLLLHGAGGSHLDWPREIQRLPGLNVFNIDLPGHGRSDGPGREDIDGYARDLDAFAVALGLRDVCLAGHSMGGAIAQSLALMRPPWLSSIVLIGTGAHLPVSPQILQGLQANTAQTVSQIMRYAWHPDSSPDLVQLAAGAMLDTGSEQLQQSFLACDNFDLREHISEIELPALVICGSDDRMTPAENSRFLAAGIPQSRLLIIENAGHFVTLEQPQLVAGAMSTFISDLHSPDKTPPADHGDAA